MGSGPLVPREHRRPERSAAPCCSSAGWAAFALVNLVLMMIFAGEETIPYHLIWASYALLYGLLPLSRRATLSTFVAVTVLTALPLVLHARAGAIGWAECSEIVLMGVVVGLLIWHVNRHRAAQTWIGDLLEDERVQAAHRELTARFGSHEVRTRLTVARALVEMMRQDSDDPSVHADAALVIGELDKATATVTTLLHLVRADALGEAETVDLDEVVRGVVGPLVGGGGPGVDLLERGRRGRHRSRTAGGGPGLPHRERRALHRPHRLHRRRGAVGGQRPRDLGGRHRGGHPRGGPGAGLPRLRDRQHRGRARRHRPRPRPRQRVGRGPGRHVRRHERGRDGEAASRCGSRLSDRRPTRCASSPTLRWRTWSRPDAGRVRTRPDESGRVRTR